MKPGLSLRVSQHLALTPQLQQSIRLLQLSTLELAQEIEQMLQDNPFLEHDDAPQSHEEGLALERSQRDDEKIAAEEREQQLDTINSVALSADSMPTTDRFESQNTSPEAAPEETEAPSTEPQDWEGDGSQDTAPDDAEWGNDASSNSSSSGLAAEGDAADFTERNTSHESLQDHLHRQALALRLSPADSAALTVLIESLSDDGYLADDLEEIAHSLGADSLEDVEEMMARFSLALKLLHSLEPTGVGARSLPECLALQLSALENEGQIHPEEAQAALSILSHPLELLAKRDIKRLAALCKLQQDDIKAAITLIASLEPKPARRFAQVERNIVIPDVIVRPVVRRGQTTFIAQLNPDVVPKLHVHDLYANALKGGKKSEAIAGLQTRLQEARWFIKNVQQRFDTIQRVSQAIVERQASFFKHGAVAMRPLVLREIADEIGMHESTISRVTTAKYMATPFGTFELKYFFGSALTTETGGIASSTAVRELIKQFIEAESKAKPLSDNAIADMLKEQGIECARRTVAKYREALRIPVTSLRKTL
jgi:RNA polymerase sigma-54 factor